MAAYITCNRNDPPNHSTICNSVGSFKVNKITILQKTFGSFAPRLGQVSNNYLLNKLIKVQIMEYMACPLILSAPSTLDLCKGGYFNLNSNILESQMILSWLDLPQCIIDEYIMLLPNIENWAMHAILICPGTYFI